MQSQMLNEMTVTVTQRTKYNKEQDSRLSTMIFASMKWGVATLLILKLIVTPISSTNTPPGGQAGSSSGSGVPSIQTSLQSLIIGQTPSIVPQQPATKTKLSREDRQKLRHFQEQQTKALISSPVSRFEGKHLYKNGNVDSVGNVKDSFASLAKDPIKAKNYLIDLNRKLYKGGVLPQAKNQFQNWFDSVNTKYVTIVDAKIGDLTNDIKPKFEAWKQAEIAKNGKLPDKFPDFTTTDKHTVTHITFHPVKDANGDVISVDVKAEKFHTHVEVGTDATGKLSHLESIKSGGQPLQTTTIASFTKAELQSNAQMTQQFWKDLGVPANAHSVLLNEGVQKYKDLKNDFDKDLSQQRAAAQGPSTSTAIPGACPSGGGTGGGGRRKRSAPGCALKLKPNGDVDSVHPKEYIGEYKRADADGKKKLSEAVKDNLGKIADGETDLNSKRKMGKLVQLEDVKKHVDAVNVVSQVESTGKVSGKGSPSGKPSSALDTLQTKFSNVKTKLSNSKMGKGLASIANSKFGKGFASGVGQVSGTLGTFFLAKTVVNGIIQGDTTSLAIVGARVGYEVGTEAAVWAGGKFFKATSKLGKAAKYLGKVAGPIGAAADIGLSVWSLTKSVGRLNSAKNQYERNDAIADIVSDSVDIAVTATVTVLSIAFPPAAPIIIAVGVVIDLLNKLVTGLYKAANEVARINSEVPLLGFEKDYVFTSRFFDWFGTRDKDYIDYLLEEKAANDLAVQHNLKFLQENPSFLGIVFPSRTLAYDGACRLTKRHCALKNAWGCTRWEELKTVERGCDWNKPCSSRWGECTDHWERVGGWGYDDFKCVCDKRAETTFGYARQNSLVDFRGKQRVYLERAVPKDVENGEFQCKPGSTSYQGYRISQESSKFEYLCQNAIALLQPSSRRRSDNSQVMLYDLNDGHDRVYLNPFSSTPNLFRVGNEGLKEFVGGGARNEYLFDGDCTKSLRGSLAGGRSQDAVTILDSCSKGGELKIDFAGGTLKDSTGNVHMTFSNIEEVTGRKGEGEHVTTSCGLRKVVLQGGSSRHPDKVDITQYYHCSYNLTLVMTGYTTVNSKASRGDITLLVDSPWRSVSTAMDIHPKTNLNMNCIFVDTPSHQVFLELSSKGHTGIRGTISRLPGKSDKFAFNFVLHSRVKQEVPLYFTETPKGSPYSVLVLSPEAPLFYHTLPKFSSSHTRRGCPNVGNLFEVEGPLWSITGGDGNDEFVLHTMPTSVDGGKGEADGVRLHKSFKAGELVDLTGSKFRSIENFYGVAGTGCKVKCACDTKLVAPQGGSKTDPDVVTVPSSKCNKRELQIVAKGRVRVVVEGEVGPAERDSVTVVAVSEKDAPLQFQLEAYSNKSAGLAVLIPVTHKNWKVKQCSRNLKDNLFSLVLHGSAGESVEFKVRPTNSAYLSSPYIQLSTKDLEEPPGHLVIEEETSTPKVIYHLTQASKSGQTTSVKGFQGISNLFRVQNASSSWNIVGGLKNDVFSISQLHGVSVDGGGGGEDTIILELHPQNVGKTFAVNLEKEEMFVLGSTQKGKLSGIHHLIGRVSQPDVMHVACHTKSVGGRGGHDGLQGEDLIFISGKNCGKASPPQMTIDLGKHTKLVNSGNRGIFTYYVESIATTKLDLHPTAENNHFVKFAVNPWQVIADIGFSEKDHVLGLKLLKSETLEKERIQAFRMFKERSSGEYVNPVFEFQRPGSFVSSDIRVLKEGVTTSTILIQGPGISAKEQVLGLPVDLNRFLINITKRGSALLGWGVIRGGRESSNQFWMFSLENYIKELDGGYCSERGACTNYLQFGESFHPGKPLEVDFNLAHLKIGSKVSILTVRNFHEVVGRSGKYDDDTVLVSCQTEQVSEFENVIIPVKEEGDCSYNLIVGIGKETRVQFKSLENSSFGLNNTFHYKFTVPRSFHLDREDDSDLIGPTHNFYLPFKVDDLEELRFNPGSERLHYKISGEEYSIAMIAGVVATEQFYLQPVMTTQEGFLIQVAIDGTVLLSLGAGSSFPSVETIKSKVVPSFGQVANKLGVTMVVQTDQDFLYVGHGKRKGDRNVLQNVGYSMSHLVGGGADDTIYEIVGLEQDVYIYPGYHLMADEMEVNRTKQTIDLTDVVVPIRMESATKYVPKVERQGDDIVVYMAGWESQYPGKIFIVDGARHEGEDSGAIQVLLNVAILDLVSLRPKASERHIRAVSQASIEENPAWQLRPRPIQIPEGMVYSLSEEDLEDGHDIQLVTSYNKNGNDSRFPNFQAVRNGTDLYLTDVVGVGSATDIMEVTTVIISDFYKGTVHETPGNDMERHNNTESDTLDTKNLPRGLLDVTVSLPGLNLLLNKSEILDISQSEWKVLPSDQVPEWRFMLYNVEEKILEGYPDIARVFTCDDCEDFTIRIFLAIVGTQVVITLIAIGIFIWCYGKQRKGKYQVLQQTDTQSKKLTKK